MQELELNGTPNITRGLGNGNVILGSSDAAPRGKKRKGTESARCKKNIADLAERSINICETEKQLLIKKYTNECELIEIKKQNQLLKQQVYLEKLAYIKEKRQNVLQTLGE